MAIHRESGRLPLLIVVAMLGAGALFARAQTDAAVGLVPVKIADINAVQMTPVTGDEKHALLVAGKGQRAAEFSRYRSADGLLDVSVKRYEPVTLALRDWPIDEFMHFVSGRVEITDSSGTTRAYGPGDSIVIPKGFSGEWKQLDTIEMITVAHGTWQ